MMRGYAAAILALQFEHGEQIEHIEEPFLCEDGETFQVRAWLRDGRDVSKMFTTLARDENP